MQTLYTYICSKLSISILKLQPQFWTISPVVATVIICEIIIRDVANNLVGAFYDVVIGYFANLHLPIFLILKELERVA